jgi:hypothetical protein
MRITKLPIPMIIAAIAITSVAVIYVYLTAPPIPIHTDPNFTTPLFAGMVYLWRGAAFEYILSADKPISVAYAPGYHLIYTNGPLGNITISEKIWIIHLRGGRTLYVERRSLIVSGGRESEFLLVYKLEDVTPPNSSIPNLYMWLPKTFNLTEFLNQNEINAIAQLVSPVNIVRVLGVEVNGTHIIYRYAYSQSSREYRGFVKLSSPTISQTIRVTNKPFGATYTISGTTFTATALPYLFFSIVPTETTKLVIYVS